jgi:hypothetical protein
VTDASAFVRTLPVDAERQKAIYWRDYKLRHGPAAGIRIADELRRQVVAIRPDWPDAREQALDRATMRRVDDALARVAPRRQGILLERRAKLDFDRIDDVLVALESATGDGRLLGRLQRALRRADVLLASASTPRRKRR